MARIKFSNGITVNFDGDPTPEDIEEIASSFDQTQETQQEPRRPMATVSDVFKRTFTPPEGAGRLIAPSDIVSGIAPYKAMERLGGIISETGVPAMQQVPILNKIPFGARVAGDPRVLASLFMGAGTKGGREAIGDVARGVSSKLPRVMGEDFTMAQSTKAGTELAKMRSTLGTRVGDIVRKTKGEADIRGVEKAVEMLPDNIKAKIGSKFYGVEKAVDGSIKSSVKNLSKLKDALDDFMTDKDWIESSKMTKGAIRRAYGAVSRAMKKAEPKLTEPMADYSKFKKLYRKAAPTVERKGEAVEKPLRGVFKKGSERSTQIAWEKLAKENPEIAEVVKNMRKYAGRQDLKKFVVKSLPLAAGGLGAGYGLKALARALTGR